MLGIDASVRESDLVHALRTLAGRSDVPDDCEDIYVGLEVTDPINLALPASNRVPRVECSATAPLTLPNDVALAAAGSTDEHMYDHCVRQFSHGAAGLQFAFQVPVVFVPLDPYYTPVPLPEAFADADWDGRARAHGRAPGLERVRGGAAALLAAFMIVDAIIVLLAETSLSPRLYGVGDTATWKLRQQAALRVLVSLEQTRRTRLGFTALMWLLVFVLRFVYSWGPWISGDPPPTTECVGRDQGGGWGIVATAPVNELVALVVAFLAVIAPVFARQSNVSLPDVEQAGTFSGRTNKGLMRSVRSPRSSAPLRSSVCLARGWWAPSWGRPGRTRC